MDDQETGQLKSIADLARLAGVSVSTVSRALTGKGALSKRTRDHIQALADRHGFRLNVAAQNLRLGRTGAIAVLMPLGHARGQQLSDPFFVAMLGFLADALTTRGYDLLLSRVLPDRDDWLDTFIRTGRTDGVIIIGQSDQGAVLDRVAADYRPMVVWGEQAADGGPATVGADNEAGGRRNIWWSVADADWPSSAMSACPNLPPAMPVSSLACPQRCAATLPWSAARLRRRRALPRRSTGSPPAIAPTAFSLRPTWWR